MEYMRDWEANYLAKLLMRGASGYDIEYATERYRRLDADLRDRNADYMGLLRAELAGEVAR